MMTIPDHRCEGHRLIVISDVDGGHVARFLPLCDGSYFGGEADPRAGMLPGPHVNFLRGGMLDVIAQYARAVRDDPRKFYTLEAPGAYARIGPQMRADEIARALGCDTADVIRHFGLLVVTT